MDENISKTQQPENPQPSPVRKKFSTLQVSIALILFVLCIAGIGAGTYLAQKKQDNRNYAAELQNTAPTSMPNATTADGENLTGETVDTEVNAPESPSDTISDTLEYFLGDYVYNILKNAGSGTVTAGQHVGGDTAGMSLTASGNLNSGSAFYVKWDNNRYEYYTWDSQFIYLRHDTTPGTLPSGGTHYMWDNARWLSRTMTRGIPINVNSNTYSEFNDDCSKQTAQTNWPMNNVIKEIIPGYQTSGLGRTDVIKMCYGVEYNTYSKDYGWIGWTQYAETGCTGNIVNPQNFSYACNYSGRYRAPSLVCNPLYPETAYSVTNPSCPGGGPSPTPGNPLTVKVIQANGTPYPNQVSVREFATSDCCSGCNGSCSNPVCTLGRNQMYSPTGCSGTGCAQWNNYTPYVGYSIGLCTGGCSDSGTVNLPSSWTVVSNSCNSGSTFTACNQTQWFKPGPGGASCKIVVAPPSPTPTLTVAPIQGYVFRDVKFNAIKGLDDPSKTNVQVIFKKMLNGIVEKYLNAFSIYPPQSTYNYQRILPNGHYMINVAQLPDNFQILPCTMITPPARANISNGRIFTCLKTANNASTISLQKWDVTLNPPYSEIENNAFFVNGKIKKLDIPLLKVPTPTITPIPPSLTSVPNTPTTTPTLTPTPQITSSAGGIKSGLPGINPAQ